MAPSRSFRGTPWGVSVPIMTSLADTNTALKLLALSDRVQSMEGRAILLRAARWLMYQKLVEPGKTTQNFDPRVVPGNPE